MTQREACEATRQMCPRCWGTGGVTIPGVCDGCNGRGFTRSEGDREAVKPQPKPRIPPLSPKEKFMIRRALQRSPESPERFGRPRSSQDIIAAIKNQALTR